MCKQEEIAEKSGSFINKRNQKLATKLYTPPSGVPLRAVLARHHGLGDYMDRNPAGHHFFANNGFAVWTFDVHGHGASEPFGERDRVAIRQFDHLVDDCEQFLTEVVTPWADELAPGTPIILNGTSMGGLASLHVAGRGNVRVDALVGSATAAGVRKNFVNLLQMPFASLMNALVPRAPVVPALEAEKLSKNPAVIQQSIDDPKLYKGSVRVCTACACLDGMARLTSVAHNIACPVLMLHGSDDLVCPAEEAEKALGRMQSKDKAWVLIEGAYHNLDMDYDKHVWERHFLDWLDERF